MYTLFFKFMLFYTIFIINNNIECSATCDFAISDNSLRLLLTVMSNESRSSYNFIIYFMLIFSAYIYQTYFLIGKM